MGCKVEGCTKRKKGHRKHNGPNAPVATIPTVTTGFLGRPPVDIETGEQPLGPVTAPEHRLMRVVGKTLAIVEPKITYRSKTGRPPFHSSDLIQEIE